MAALVAMLATYGLQAVLQIIQAYKDAGEPTEAEIRALIITKKPEDYFPPRKE